MRKTCYDKRYEDLTFADDFMFKLILEDAAICKRFIEPVIGRRMECINTGARIRSFVCCSAHTCSHCISHSVRFDVYVEGSDKVIDIEIQTADTKELTQRARVYQDSIDIETFHKGERYSDIKESYIVFLCTFDPFVLGLPVYTVEQVFKEARSELYDDRTHKVFFNCRAFEQCADGEIRAVLKLIMGKEADTEFTKAIVSEIRRKIENRDVRNTFMGVKEIIAEQKTEWIAQGERNKAIDTARKALECGIAMETVAAFTGLSVEEIAAL